jgi:hypothetical protein
MTSQSIRRGLTAAAAVGLVAAPLSLAHASSTKPAAHAAGQKVVVKGLNSPSEVQFGPGGALYVASIATGDVVRSAAKGGKGKVIFPHAAGAVAPVNATTTKVANLLAFEKANNPDRQKQCVGKHCDSLSNPFSLLNTTQDILVADAGANDIVAYDKATGVLHTYHVFSNIRDTKQCKNARNNDPQHPGCDPVPTGLARGPGNTVFVSLLGAEAPHAAKIVELDLTTGTEIRRWGHLTDVDGVAVSPSGVVYASELGVSKLNPKAPNFDKAGRIVRIDHGHRTYARVSTPAGLIWHNGALYAASHTLEAIFANIKGKGVVVRVAQSAFH